MPKQPLTLADFCEQILNSAANIRFRIEIKIENARVTCRYPGVVRLRVLKVKAELKQYAVHAAGIPGAADAVCCADHELQCTERGAYGLWSPQPEWMLRQRMHAQRWRSLCAGAMHFHLERLA